MHSYTYLMKRDYGSYLILLFCLLISTSFVDGCTYYQHSGPRVRGIHLTEDSQRYLVDFDTGSTTSGSPEEFSLILDTQNNKIAGKGDETQSQIVENNYQPEYLLSVNQTSDENTTILWEVKNQQDELVFDYHVFLESDIVRSLSFYSNSLEYAFFIYGPMWGETQGISVSVNTLELHTLTVSMGFNWIASGVLSSHNVFDELQIFQVGALCCVCITQDLFAYTATEISPVETYYLWEYQLVDLDQHTSISVGLVGEEGTYDVKEIDLETLEKDLWTFSISDMEDVLDTATAFLPFWAWGALIGVIGSIILRKKYG